MGEFAKRLGQLAARSFQSESARILTSARLNKHGLSLALDKTLRDGHDMRVFGLGTAASLADRERYARFTASMHAVYSAMEHRLDHSVSPANRLVWDPLGKPPLAWATQWRRVGWARAVRSTLCGR
jgi:hypothetical protein